MAGVHLQTVFELVYSGCGRTGIQKEVAHAFGVVGNSKRVFCTGNIELGDGFCSPFNILFIRSKQIQLNIVSLKVLTKKNIMKKLLVFAVAVLVASVSFGQAAFKPSIGLSLNNFSGSSGDFKAKPGAQIGASVAFGKKFYIEPGVYYSSKSTEFVTSGSSNVTEDLIVKGIRVPVAVGVGILGNEESVASLRAFGGASGFFVTGVGDGLNKEDMKSPSFGVFAGVGVDFWIAFAEVSYEWSMSDASKDLTKLDVGKSRTMFFTLGLKF